MLLPPQSPGAAQVDHPHSALHGFWRQRARGLVGCRQKQHIYFLLLHRRPGERLQFPPVTVRRKQRHFSGDTCFPPEEHGTIHPRMTRQQSRQFHAGIASSSQNSRLHLSLRHPSSPFTRCTSLAALLLFSATIKIASSPAMVPTTSGQLSPSSAAATGWALPTAVLTTTRFCAWRTSSTNSRTSREAEGNAASDAVPPPASAYPSAVFTRASSRMSRESVACPTLIPFLLNARCNSSWLAIGLSWTSSRIALCRPSFAIDE